MSDINEGIGPVLYVYAGEGSLDALITEVEEKGEKKIFLSQSDLWKLTEDIQKYVPDFKCFSVLQVSDYMEVEDGEERLTSQFTRNETKFIIRGGILEVEVYNM